MTAYCGAKTRAGGQCKRPAGWGTDHSGQGRCKLHGGASLKGADSPQYKTGRYSRYLPEKLRAKVEAFEEADVLDIVPELQVQRALFAEYVGRFEIGFPLSRDDIGYLMDWASEITRTAERIAKMRNDTALTAAEVAYIAARLPEVVAKYIHDKDLQQRFVAELFNAVGATGQRQPHQITDGQ